MEKPFNLFQTTLSSNYTIGDTVLNVSATAGITLSAGDSCRMLLYSTSGGVTPIVVLKITAVNSSTQFACSPETSDANAPTGSSCICTLSAGAMNQIKIEAAAGVNAVSFSTTPAFDLSKGRVQTITLTNDVVSSTATGAVPGAHYTFVIGQDGTGGRSFVWPTSFKGAMVIDASSIASTKTVQQFVYDGTDFVSVTPGVINE